MSEERTHDTLGDNTIEAPTMESTKKEGHHDDSISPPTSAMADLNLDIADKHDIDGNPSLPMSAEETAKAKRRAKDKRKRENRKQRKQADKAEKAEKAEQDEVEAEAAATEKLAEAGAEDEGEGEGEAGPLDESGLYIFASKANIPREAPTVSSAFKATFFCDQINKKIEELVKGIPCLSTPGQADTEKRGSSNLLMADKDWEDLCRVMKVQTRLVHNCVRALAKECNPQFPPAMRTLAWEYESVHAMRMNLFLKMNMLSVFLLPASGEAKAQNVYTLGDLHLWRHLLMGLPMPPSSSAATAAEEPKADDEEKETGIKKEE